MGKFNYKDYLKNNPLTNGDKESLNESAPGFENRKQGEPLPTLDSVREEYEKKELNEDKFTSPELQKAADDLSTAVIALRKASVAKGFYKGNDDWTAFEKAYSVLIQDLKSKEVRS